MYPPIKKILFTIGFPFSPFYSQLMVVRASLYRKKIFRTHTLPVPVISVGNLTMGGTGKTPLVMYLVKKLAAQGCKPAIVSRGYRGKSNNEVNIVSDGFRVLMEADQCGDEPWLLANELDGVVVATGKNRLLPCREVIDSYGCDIIVLDDGFQHLRIERTIDLVLFDTEVFAGNSRVFPGGELREPVSALQRCDAFVLTGITRSNQSRTAKCSKLLLEKFRDKALFQFNSSYPRAIQYGEMGAKHRAEMISVDQLPQNLFCFCGIANPQRFQQQLAESGITVSGFKIFNDHHSYTEKDLDQLITSAHGRGAPGLLTTEKDITKVKNLYKNRLPVFTLPIEFNDNHDFDRYIMQNLDK